MLAASRPARECGFWLRKKRRVRRCSVPAPRPPAHLVVVPSPLHTNSLHIHRHHATRNTQQSARAAFATSVASKHVPLMLAAPAPAPRLIPSMPRRRASSARQGQHTINESSVSTHCVPVAAWYAVRYVRPALHCAGQCCQHTIKASEQGAASPAPATPCAPTEHARGGRSWEEQCMPAGPHRTCRGQASAASGIRLLHATLLHHVSACLLDLADVPLPLRV